MADTRAGKRTSSAEADQRLSENEARYRALVDDLPVLICRFTPDGTLTFVNEAFARHFGKADEELVGHSFVALIPGEEREHVAAQLHSLSRHNPLATYEQRVVAPGGEVRWQRWTSRAIFEGDRTVEFQCIGEDITGQVRTGQLLQALNQAALAMARAFTPEQIFATVTHELKKLGIHCAIFLTDESRTTLSPRYLSYGTRVVKAAEKLTGLKAAGFSIPVEAVDIYRQGVWERQTVFVGNVQDIIQQLLPGPFKRFAGQIERVLKVPKAINAPLVVEDEVIGLLSVQSDDLRESDAPAITVFAHQIAAAWRKAQLFEQAQQEIAERKRAEEALRRANEELERYAADMERRSTQLKTAAEVSRAATAILDPDELTQHMVDLIQGRFELYYVGLFLVDRAGAWTGEAGRWAVLRAGTGQAGRIQLQQGHKLEIGDTSMIGWCIAHRQARIALDVGEEAVRFDNPLLPETRSELALPLVSRGQVIGAMTVQSVREAAFSNEDIAVLQTMADQLANAIENARLFEAERRRWQEAETLREAALALTTSLDRDQVVERILGQLQGVVPYDSASVQLLKGEWLKIVGGRGFPNLPELLGLAFAMNGDNPNSQVVRTRAPFIVADGPAVYEEFRREPHAQAGIHAWLGVPMLVGERLVGIITLDKREPGFYTPEHARLAEAFAAQAAIAIENARLYQETARRLAQAQALSEAVLAAASSLDFDQVLGRTCATLQVTMGVEFLCFALPDEEGKELVLHPAQIGFPSPAEGFRLPMDRSVCGRVFQTGEPVTSGNVHEEPCYYEGSPQVRSELAIPVRLGKRIIAVLNVESRRPDAFDRDDSAFYTAIAGQLGVALENARLYQQVRRQAGELAAAVARLQELDRLKSEFIQNVSHELRTPLALVRGHAELLEAGELGPLRPRQRESVAVIAQRARVLSNLVQDIMFLLEAEVRPAVPMTVFLGELVQTACESFQATARQAGLALHVAIAPNLPPVSGSPAHLRRVLDNLLSNAAKFTPSGGTISVRVDGEVDWLALTISDTGIGIAADQLERIFDRFYQVDGSAQRRYGGTGLGLALVKQVVEAYGGHVRVESRLGEGSTFTVTLPIFQA